MQRAVGTVRLTLTVPAWLLRKKYLVLVKDLQSPVPPLPVDRKMNWTLLTESVLPQALSINPALTEHEIRRRWSEGQNCHLCWIEGQIAHYRWDTSRPAYLPYLGKTFDVHEGDLLITEAYTHGKFRNLGIHTISSLLAMHQAKNTGFTRVIGLAACWNSPALRAMRKAGRQSVGTVGYWHVIGTRYYFATGSASFDDKGNMVILRSQAAGQGRL
ncbi:MAG: hypothetical protein HY695_15465 [Deltaproteobacteria bacterium]|nr:hypothetical protein [Deltaproteobacteria bacterium]